MEQKEQFKYDIPYQVKGDSAAKIQDIDMAGRTITAVANTYYFFDSDSDVLIPGCAKRSIRERGSRSNANDKILHALFHDLTRLAGKSMDEMETEVDGKKVLAASSYLPETVDGEDSLIKYKAGMYNQHSIGLRYKDVEYAEANTKSFDAMLSKLINPEKAVEAGYMFIVKEIEWYEWSTVAFGANKLTPYLGVKSENKKITALSVIEKMNAMIEKSRGIKDQRIFDLQLKQLEQMILELTMIEPSVKELARASGKDNQSSYEYFKSNLKI